MLLQLICKTKLVSKSVKLYFLNFLKKCSFGKKTSQLSFRDFTIQFCIQISHLGVKKNHLGVKKNQFSKKVKIKILGKKCHF